MGGRDIQELSEKIEKIKGSPGDPTFYIYCADVASSILAVVEDLHENAPGEMDRAEAEEVAGYLYDALETAVTEMKSFSGDKRVGDLMHAWGSFEPWSEEKVREKLSRAELDPENVYERLHRLLDQEVAEQRRQVQIRVDEVKDELDDRYSEMSSGARYLLKDRTMDDVAIPLTRNSPRNPLGNASYALVSLAYLHMIEAVLEDGDWEERLGTSLF